MMKSTVLLSTAYWGPVQYYARLYAYPQVCLEACEHYVKQTYRNRCVIDSPSGIQVLTVPVVKPDAEKCSIRDIRISDHGNWRHLHWNALESAYRNSPYFEYYADDIRRFYTDKWEFLYEFNEAICHKVCELLDVQPLWMETQGFGAVPSGQTADDCRSLLSPKVEIAEDTDFRPVSYYQVFADKHGFRPNLSVADLLFNMGPESLFVLRDSFCGDVVRKK
ncbi:MAG: WbqC family protein [Clostridium sp.]|nr:WbqC family protein [Clostridium sp.]